MTTSNNAPIRFEGLRGAIVTLHSESRSRAWWVCECGASEDDQPTNRAREAANGHAAICRALPRKEG